MSPRPERLAPGGIPEVSLTATTGDLERTARDTMIAQWGVAAVVMTGSMAAGGFSFHDLGEPWPLGVLSAFAVDLALAAWLRIAARLRALGITAPLGSVLEVTAAAMTLFLNIGAALFPGIHPGSPAARALLAVAHSFLPVALVLVTMAGGQAQLSLLRLRRDTDTQAQAEALARRSVDTERAERARDGEIRLAELAAARQDQEIADRREQRAHAQRLMVGSLASVLSVGATWRHHSRPAPRRSTPARPQRLPVPERRAVPAPVPAPVLVTDELLSQARQVRERRASQGKTAGRAVLQWELRVPEKTARELARRLGTTQNQDRARDTELAPTHHRATTSAPESEGKAA